MHKATMIAAAVIGLAASVALAGWVAAPTNWIAGYTSDGTNLTIPIASLPMLTAAEASASTGDVREVVFAITDKFYTMFQDTASTNHPGKISVARQGSEFNTGSTSTLRRAYSVQVDINTTNMNVMSE